MKCGRCEREYDEVYEVELLYHKKYLDNGVPKVGKSERIVYDGGYTNIDVMPFKKDLCDICLGNVMRYFRRPV